MTPRWLAVLDALRKSFASETLPPSPPAAPPRRERHLGTLLFSIEPLPSERVPAPHPPRAALALLFPPEPLPLEPEAAPRRRLHWLAWLLAPERLDRDSNGHEV